MLKKIIYLWSVILTLSLASCGSDNDEPETDFSNNTLIGAWKYEPQSYERTYVYDDGREEKSTKDSYTDGEMLIFGENNKVIYAHQYNDPEKWPNGTGWSTSLCTYNPESKSIYRNGRVFRQVKAASKKELVIIEIGSKSPYNDYYIIRSFTFKKVSNPEKILGVDKLDWGE